MARTTARERRRRRALAFQPCPDCLHDIAEGTGPRSCSYGACPYLPEELDPHCPVCGYNLFTGEGEPACGDPSHCGLSPEEAAERLELLGEWLALHDLPAAR